MHISELIKHVGDENVQMQTLSDSLVSANVTKRDGRITFATDRSIVLAMSGLAPEKLTCLILWLPKDRMPTPEEMAAHKAINTAKLVNALRVAKSHLDSVAEFNGGVDGELFDYAHSAVNEALKDIPPSLT